MFKILAKTAFIGAALSIGAFSSAFAQDTPTLGQTTVVQAKLKGYVFGFPIVKARYGGRFTDTTYSVRADLRSSGLAALLKKLHIWSTTTGIFDGSDLVPKTHIQQNMDKKHRRVEMYYGKDKLDISIVPRLGSQGKPPASEKQRFESDDALSAILNMMMRGYRTGDEPCTGSVPVFDSKQHYNLRMQRNGTRRIRQRGYKGDTIRCLVYYEPVAGFDPEDLPSAEEQGTPITMYLANFEDIGMYVPIRMVYKISGFKAVVKVREITISKE